MRYQTHETDLQILHQSRQEKLAFLNWCNDKGLKPQLCFSDVKGQDWYGQPFYEIPFRSDLIPEIVSRFNAKPAHNGQTTIENGKEPRQ